MAEVRQRVELLEKNKPQQERAKRTYEAILSAAAELLERALRLLPDPRDDLAGEISARQAQLRQQATEPQPTGQQGAPVAWQSPMQTASAMAQPPRPAATQTA